MLLLSMVYEYNVTCIEYEVENMQVEIRDIELLVTKDVPEHGNVSGIRSESGTVKVIIPNDYTEFSLKISNPSEIMHRNVTKDGKILGLKKYAGKKIFVIDQSEDPMEQSILSYIIVKNETFMTN